MSQTLRPQRITFWLPLILCAFWPFKVTQGHRLLHKPKANVWFPISDLYCNVIWTIFRRFWDTALRSAKPIISLQYDSLEFSRQAYRAYCSATYRAQQVLFTYLQGRRLRDDEGDMSPNILTGRQHALCPPKNHWKVYDLMRIPDLCLLVITFTSDCTILICR